MLRLEHLEAKSSTLVKITEILIYLKEVRQIKFSEIARQINVRNTYLSGIYNGSRPANEDFLFRLEKFFRFNNLEQAAQIERQILELQRQKTMLVEQTIEKFYAERGVLKTSKPNPPASFNETPVNSATAAQAATVAAVSQAAP
jgi:transcriptional regulator with XRE-family HTH domain